MPNKELKAFAKVQLGAGEVTEIRFELWGLDLAVYDPRVAAWTTMDGVFDLFAGASSRAIRLRGSVTVEATQARHPAGPLEPAAGLAAPPSSRQSACCNSSSSAAHSSWPLRGR